MWNEAYDPKQMHANSETILSLLHKEIKTGRIIAITDTRLHSPTYGGYVYGYGHMEVPVCVVSYDGFGRLNSGSPLPWARLVRVIVHELGHTLGLKHHEEPTKNVHCVMNMVNNSDDRPGLDFLTHEFCRRCLGDVMAGRSQFAEGKKEKPCSVLS
jgi:predicted Zn-dependent protease